MHDMLQKICNQYLAATLSPLKNNQLAQYIRTDTKEIISSSVNLDLQRYRVHGSSGQGQWAVIPWIAIFDLDITNTATHGYYIVYLFTADMQGVYLSLNQGWTYYENEYGGKRGLEKIREATSIIQSNLDISEKGFTKEKISLNVPSSYSSSTRLQAEGYELGHIVGKYYPRNKMPNDEELKKDLLAMLDLYDQLKKQNNNQYKDIYNAFKTPEKTSNKKTSNSSFDEDTPVILTEEELHPVSRLHSSRGKSKPIKKDYAEKEELNSKYGLCGENSVIEHERKRLNKLGRQDLANQVEQISLRDDGAGYDIKSFDVTDASGNYKNRYIEVKTTPSNLQDGFYISSNELTFAKEHKDEYYLYRIYSLKKGQAKLHIFDYDELEKLKIIPCKYYVVFANE